MDSQSDEQAKGGTIMEDHPEWPNVLATEDPDPGEVNQFYDMLKSHPKFSEVPRDDLLEIIEKELRSRNREVIESQDLHKKYLNFIEHKYVPLHPELHQLENWEFEVDTLEAIALGLFEESVKTEVNGTVYAFPLLKASTCQRLIEEVAHFEQWCVRNGVTVNRPNTMNNYGAVLDDFGFRPVLNALTEAVVNPLSKLYFPHIGPTCNRHHGFIVEYALDKDRALDFHVDESDVTLNLCLGEAFEGGELYFGGIRCHMHQQHLPATTEEARVQHRPGQALLHLGKHRHAANAITSGHRLNLILWCKSSAFRTCEKDRESEKGYHATWCPVVS